MIEFRLDRGSAVPAYAQLVAQVREAIRLGWLRPGDQLPTVRDVVASAVVNPNTVLKAYRELSTTGLVVGHPGRGTFVASSVQAVDQRTLLRLRRQLDAWISTASGAGLGKEDIEAVVHAALNDVGRGEAGEIA